MKKIYVTLTNIKGFAAFDVCVIILVLTIALSLAISTFAIFPKVQNLKSTAIEMARTAETAGRIGSAVDTTLNNLSATSNLSPTVQWNVSYIPGTDKIQSGTEFTLILTDTAKLELGTLFSIEIPIKATASGRGEVVWK